jgi:hypothetical protein
MYLITLEYQLMLQISGRKNHTVAIDGLSIDTWINSKFTAYKILS